MEKAYKNLDFLNSRDARSLRILSEYLEPQARFRHYNVTDTVVFFGSARAEDPNAAREALERARKEGDEAAVERARRAAQLARYYDDARVLAQGLTEWSKELGQASRRFIVCSGGGPGIMEAANRGRIRGLGNLYRARHQPADGGDPPTHTSPRELGFEFHYFFMRKFWFVYLAKALVVFPGGFGTLDELFELLTLLQTQKTGKQMPVVLYGEEFWNDVINFDALVRWGTISSDDLALFHKCSAPEDALAFLKRELTRLYLEAESD